jgi:hypothetical protein
VSLIGIASRSANRSPRIATSSPGRPLGGSNERMAGGKSTVRSAWLPVSATNAALDTPAETPLGSANIASSPRPSWWPRLPDPAIVRTASAPPSAARSGSTPRISEFVASATTSRPVPSSEIPEGSAKRASRAAPSANPRSAPAIVMTVPDGSSLRMRWLLVSPR